jgi:outer membrane receptor for ferrienterochelin and colicins
MLRHRALLALFVSLTSSAPALAAEQRATMLHTAAAHATPGEQLQIDGSLAPGNEQVKKVVLKFRGPGEDYAEAPMEIQYGDLYRGFLPARAVRHPAVEYYIEAITADGSRIAIFQTASKPARVTVSKEDGAETPEAYKEKPEPAEPAEKTKESAASKEPAEEKKPPCKPVKKTRKGKKQKAEPCVEESAQEKTEVAAAETEKPVKDSSKETALEKEREKEKEPAREEPKASAREREKEKEKEKEREAEDEPRPKKGASKERDAARRAEREKRTKEMEEELKVYAAEDPSATRVRNDKESTRDPRLTQIVTARQLKQLGVRTIPEALDLLQGISISRSMQGFYRVAVRGIRGDADVLFLYDGHPMNDLYDGKAIINLPIETVDRLEITRGPMPLSAGTGAVLMQVNIVPNRDVGIRAAFSGGSYNNPFGVGRSSTGFDGALSAAGEFGPVKLGLDGTVWSHGGYIEPINRDALETDTIRQGKREAGSPAGWTNDQNLRVNVGAGGELSLDAVGQLWVKGRFLLENRAGLMGLFDAVGDDSRLAWTQVLIDLGWKKKLSDLLTLSAKGWFDQRNTTRTWQLSPRDYDTNFSGTFNASSPTFFPEGIVEQTRVGERTFGLQVQGDLELPFHNALVAGLSFEYRGVYDYAFLTNYDSLPVTTYRGASLQVWHDPAGTEQRILVGAKSPSSNRAAIGILLGDTWRPIEALAIDVGLRVDLTQLPVADANGTGFSGAAFYPFFGPRVALSFAATPGLLLKLSYGRMLRTPTVQEYAETLPNSVPDQGRFVGNPALKPSTTDTVEAGLDWMQGFGDARLKLRGSAFFSSIADAIHPVDPSGNLVPYANRTSGVFVVGADGEARLDVGRMGAFLNASWFRALDNGTPASGQLLTDAPQVRLNSGISLPLGPWLAFDVNFRYGAERRNNQRSTLELLRRYTLPAYAIVGAQIRTEPLFDHVELAVSATNVFNFDFSDDAPRMDATRTPGGVPREGWGVFGTIRGWY